MSAPTFEDFCRVWPMRSDDERAMAEIAFAEVPEARRADTIVACDAWRGLMEHHGRAVPPASTVLQHRNYAGFDYLARREPEVRNLMRGAA